MLSFSEKVKLETSKLVMKYRAAGKSGRPYFAYIYCDERGVKKMHDDYENNITAKPESYGEVIYSDAISEPDEKAKEFLKNWLAGQGGEEL